jgi:hypothetical protein
MCSAHPAGAGAAGICAGLTRQTPQVYVRRGCLGSGEAAIRLKDEESVDRGIMKLGIDIAQSTVAKYMSRRHGPRSPGWQAFLRNRTAQIASVDLSARRWQPRPRLCQMVIPVTTDLRRTG